MKVSIGKEDFERSKDIYTSISPDYEFVPIASAEEALEAAPQAEVIMAGPIKGEILEAATNLRWLQLGSTGVDPIFRKWPWVKESSFVITNAKGVHGIPMAESIFAMMLAFVRHVKEAVEQRPNHKVIRRPPAGELAGKTILVVGLGSIGENTAKRAKAFDMKVIGVRRNPELGSDYADEVHPPEKLLDLIPRADFVADTLPLTPDTYHIIGEKEIAAMKPTAYIFNVGRGKTIDQEALKKALIERRIAGAGLDVFEKEPLAPEDEMWDLDNVIFTPHISGVSKSGNAQRHTALFSENLRRFAAGEPLLNVVDKKAGY